MATPTTKIDTRTAAQIDAQYEGARATSSAQYDAQCEAQPGRLDPTAWEFDAPPFACSDFGEVQT